MKHAKGNEPVFRILAGFISGLLVGVLVGVYIEHIGSGMLIGSVLGASIGFGSILFGKREEE